MNTLRNLILTALFLQLGWASSRSHAMPMLVDLGSENEVFGVSRLQDGTAVLVGATPEHGFIASINSSGVFSFSSTGSIADDSGRLLPTSISHDGSWFSASEVVGAHTFGVLGAVSDGDSLEVINSPAQVLTTVATGVSNDGMLVGTSGGRGFSWTRGEGIRELSSGGPAFVHGVNASGDLIVGATTGDSRDAVIWSSEQSFLPNQLQSGEAIDVSANGLFIGGQAVFFDTFRFEELVQASLWVDTDGVVGGDQLGSDYTQVLLTDIDGNPFQGAVLSVSDNGYAVGESPLGAFIWHESFGGVRLFEEWLFSEHGLTLPTTALAVRDVFFDGVNLNFAVHGSAYFVSTPLAAVGGNPGTQVPEPATGLLLLGGLGGFAFRRRRQTSFNKDVGIST